MRSPPLEDVDHDQAHDEGYDFETFDFSKSASQLTIQEENKENGTLLATQRSQHDDDALYPPLTPHNKQLPPTPHPSHVDAADGASLGATSEMLPQSGRLSPPLPIVAVPRPPRANMGPRPPSATMRRPPSTRTLKRKLAEVEEDEFFPEGDAFNNAAFLSDPTFPGNPTFDDEHDTFAEMTNNFDPTAEVMPFDVLDLPNEAWDGLQKEQVQKIRQFTNNMVFNSMLLSVDVTHALHTSSETTRQELIKSIDKIKSEQEKHRQSVAQFRQYAQFVEESMRILGGGVEERDKPGQRPVDGQRPMDRERGMGGKHGMGGKRGMGGVRRDGGIYR